MRKCILPGCEGKHYAKDFCEKHYRRWKRGAGHWKGYLDMKHCAYCQEEVYAKGLCRKHYQQWKRGNLTIFGYDPYKDSEYD